MVSSLVVSIQLSLIYTNHNHLRIEYMKPNWGSENHIDVTFVLNAEKEVNFRLHYAF